MSEIDDLKVIIKESKKNLSESVTLPELVKHHEVIADHIHSGKHSPDLMAKLNHIHQRLGHTINNVHDEIEKHEDMADWHEEQSGGQSDMHSDNAPHDSRDFSEETRRDVYHHLNRISDAHDELTGEHSNAAEWHREQAEDLKNGNVEIPEELHDNTPFPEKKPEPVTAE